MENDPRRENSKRRNLADPMVLEKNPGIKRKDCHMLLLFKTMGSRPQIWALKVTHLERKDWVLRWKPISKEKARLKNLKQIPIEEELKIIRWTMFENLDFFDYTALNLNDEGSNTSLERIKWNCHWILKNSKRELNGSYSTIWTWERKNQGYF